jgi:two-component system, OmpR family, response regulator
LKARILILDSDFKSGQILKKFLLANNLDVYLEKDGLKGIKKLKSEIFDLCILETNIPSKNGFSITSEIRQNDDSLPVFFLTTNTSKSTILKAYSSGADDYFKKPFDKDIFLIKIKNILKDNYSFNNETSEFYFGKFYFNANIRTLTFDAIETVKLSPKECYLLKLFLININDFVSKSDALRLIWKKEDYFTSKSMAVFIGKLRKHLSIDKNITIVNVRDSGYRLIVNHIP